MGSSGAGAACMTRWPLAPSTPCTPRAKEWRTLWPVLLCEPHASKVEPLVGTVCMGAEAAQRGCMQERAEAKWRCVSVTHHRPARLPSARLLPIHPSAHLPSHTTHPGSRRQSFLQRRCAGSGSTLAHWGPPSPALAAHDNQQSKAARQAIGGRAGGWQADAWRGQAGGLAR